MAKDVPPELAGAREGDQGLPEVAQREGPAELINQATRRAPRVHHRHDRPEPRGDLPELGEHRKRPRSPAEGHDAFVNRVAHVFSTPFCPGYRPAAARPSTNHNEYQLTPQGGSLPHGRHKVDMNRAHLLPS